MDIKRVAEWELEKDVITPLYNMLEEVTKDDDKVLQISWGSYKTEMENLVKRVAE